MRVGDGTVAVETYFFPSWWAGNKLCVPKHFGQWSSWTAFNVSGGVSVSAALQVNQTCLGPNQVSNLTFYCANTSHINYLLTYQCVAIRLQYLSHRWFSQCLLKHTDQQMEASFNFFYMIVHAGWLVCVCVGAFTRVCARVQPVMRVRTLSQRTHQRSWQRPCVWNQTCRMDSKSSTKHHIVNRQT